MGSTSISPLEWHTKTPHVSLWNLDVRIMQDAGNGLVSKDGVKDVVVDGAGNMGDLGWGRRG